MEIPEELLYTEEHLWLLVEGDTATIGVSEYLQEDLEELTSVELPQTGDLLELGSPMATAESINTLFDFYAPLTGEVLEINDALEDSPEWLHHSPYEDGWLLRMKIEVSAELEDLLESDDYQDFIDGF
ncbi:glycine cleavage system protein H [Syntrophotalea acetylenivorans]|uniref:Glycine cleavage system H protein n=1 Tax=Syntrophotalea acetylenivorans TaxID=1842532 RepID=A0A1L3GS69_9BACT|nr:glycine cleavage system protein GcvH [Syntrophotalea acetylenivorans]APG28710.1 glycine cleavage system protein H [Syntrophotalea acetylenivorans]